jgi:hypothetical protein
MGGVGGGYGGRMMGGGYGGGMMAAGGGGYGGMMGGGAVGTTAETIDYKTTQAETVMVRFLDYTVEPDTTYRFRVATVVANPNYKKENVFPGVDNTSVELVGPWSEPTDPVPVPADVIPFAANMAPAPPDRAAEVDKVSFKVAAWNDEDGVTAVRTFEAGPGRLIGETRNVRVPVFDDDAKEDTKPEQIDFGTRQLVLDSEGGTKPLPKLPGLAAGNLEEPAIALLLRPDGSVVVRDQAVDKHNGQMDEMEQTYKKAIKEAEKKDKKAPAGMMGGYGGMMGGPGGMRRGAR